MEIWSARHPVRCLHGNLRTSTASIKTAVGLSKIEHERGPRMDDWNCTKPSQVSFFLFCWQNRLLGLAWLVIDGICWIEGLILETNILLLFLSGLRALKGWQQGDEVLMKLTFYCHFNGMSCFEGMCTFLKLLFFRPLNNILTLILYMNFYIHWKSKL